MQGRRTLVLMGILLALLAAFLFQNGWGGLLNSGPHPIAPLPGVNSIQKFTVTHEPSGEWMAHIDYFYTGSPASALLLVTAARVDEPQHKDARFQGSALKPLERGSHHVDIALVRPADSQRETSTAFVRASFWQLDAETAAQTLAQNIDWPDQQTYWSEAAMRSKSNAQLLKEATAAIDSGGGGELEAAQDNLKALLARDPQAVQAYVELARCAMKLHWGPDGLHQAETLLDSALSIDKDNKNARILQAYVYAHQGRHALAMKLNEEVARSGTDNLWLWVNFGELQEMRGDPKAAVAKYREAIALPRPHNEYDRAQNFAYDRLIELLSARNDLDGLQAVYEQHVQSYGKADCYSAQFARFLVEKRGDVAGGIALADAVAAGPCRSTAAQKSLGVVRYSAWAASPEASRAGLLNKARLSFPPGPQLLLALAGSEGTLPTLRLLLQNGETIDERDNGQMNALAYALIGHDHAAAKRLLSLGANVIAAVGPEGMPVALLPVLDENAEGIRLMQKAGVNYSTLAFQGTTAVELARRGGNTRLLELLKGAKQASTI